MDSIDKEEMALSNELRSYCSHYGVEGREFLNTTATLLLKLGKIYASKASATDGILRKLSYIRCAVLLYAAQARFHITENEVMLAEVCLAIDYFERMLERSCTLTPNSNLYKLSIGIKKRVRGIRSRIKTELYRVVFRHNPVRDKDEFLEKISNILSMDQLIIDDDSTRYLSRDAAPDEGRVISEMRTFMDDVTNQYKSVMCEIAQTCLNLLPEPPCKFCIVGLGSFARGEVTMFSDFEHVILLDANPDTMENRNVIAEYFRWYSVVFQIVVIGMGETIIPSVTIKCLNDAYSDDPTANWFYDKYTPRGISFDGMLPHSCNIPLGRVQTTEKRKHVVELIQTPEKMASFLSVDECEKNGYYLGEVLRQTRFVFGDMSTYESFRTERQQILSSEGAFGQEKYEKFVENNSNPNVRESQHLTDITAFDAKNIFYRPVVTLLTFLGQVHSMAYDSLFDLIDQMLESGVLDKLLHHDLSYALAVACEMRWKLYLVAEEQRHSAELKDITGIVGENAIHACKNVLPRLRELLSGKEKERIEMKEAKEMLISISSRGNFEESVKFGERIIRQLNGEEVDMTFFTIRVLCDSYKVGCISHSKRSEYWTKCEDLYRGHICGKSLSYCDAIEVFPRMSVMYYTQGRFDESMEESRKFFEANRMMLEIDGKIHREFAPNFQQYHELVFQRMNVVEAEKHLQDVMWDDPSIAVSVDCDFTKRYYKALILALHKPSNGGSETQAKEEFRTLAIDAKEKANKLQQPRRFLFTILFRQISYIWFDDAIQSVEFIEQNPMPAYSQYELALVLGSCIDVIKFFCLCRLGRYKKALAWAESDVEIAHSDLDKSMLYRLTRGLLTQLWRKMQAQNIEYGKNEASLILLFVTKFVNTGQVSDLLSSPNIKTRSGALLSTMNAQENFYGRNYGMEALQTLRNIQCVVKLMFVGFPIFLSSQ